jgi:hypothetical protein
MLRNGDWLSCAARPCRSVKSKTGSPDLFSNPERMIESRSLKAWDFVPNRMVIPAAARIRVAMTPVTMARVLFAPDLDGSRRGAAGRLVATGGIAPRSTAGSALRGAIN